MPVIDFEGLPDKEPVEAAAVVPSGIDFEALPDKEVSKGLTSPERLPRWTDIKDKIPANMQGYEQDAKDAISAAATYDLDMNQAYSIQGKLKEELNQPNLWDQAQGSFKAGMGDVYVGMGNTLKWAGMDETFSDVYVDFGERMRDAYIPAADQSDFSWRKTIDPEWWATTVTRSVPFTLSLIPAAIVGAYGGAAAAGAAGLGTFGTTVVAALGGAAASRPLESAFEAAAAYETALARGDSEEDASSAADKVFASNMLLVGMDAAQFAVAFTPLKFGKGLKPSLLRRMSAGTGKLSAVAISEAGEERYQEYVQMEALGEEANFFDLDNPRLNEASTIGGIFGAGMAGTGSVWNALTKKTTEAMPEDVQKTFNDAKAAALADGVDEAQATREALDAVADTPEGKEHIETVLKDMEERASVEMPVEGKPEITAPTIEELFEKLKTEDLTEEELGSLLDQFAGGREIIEEVVAEPVAEIKERLLATGMGESEAAANAALFDGFRVLAQRAGVSVDDLMSRYLPEIAREGVEEVAAPVITEEDKRAITDNPFLSDQITTEEQLTDTESLRAARERINETLVEQREEQTVSDEEMLQLGEAVEFLDAKIAVGTEVPLTQPTQEGIAPNGPRARIKFTADKVLIDLFKNADESSFVHETGHLYFRMMADLTTLDTASEELKTDFETLKTWIKYEEGQVGFTVDQQEQFARGFEAYLREGKAPSSALAEAFENFKQWLMQIYKSLRDLDVELTPEVRGVMDRMLADEGVTLEQEAKPVTLEPWQMRANGREFAEMSFEEVDRAAFGFSEEDITTLQPGQLNIKWQQDYDNVIEEQEASGLSKEDWAEQIDLSEPIEVIYENGEFKVDDGYHRWYAATILNKPLNVELEIKDKPHRAIVEKALREGKPVTEEVLAPYDDLRGQGVAAEEGISEEVFEQAPRLSALHNLTEENLKFADEIGGLAAPSIGVVKEDMGIEGYGGITMIGARELGAPGEVEVYDADAYTSTFPTPEYKKAKVKDADELSNELRPWAEKFDDSNVVYMTFEHAYNYPNPEKVIDTWLNSNAVRAMFLEDITGKKIRPITKETKATYSFTYSPEVRAWFKNEFSPEADNKGWDDPVRQKQYKDLGIIVRKVMEDELFDIYTKMGESNPRELARKDVATEKSHIFKEDGSLGLSLFESMRREQQDYGKKKVDSYDTADKLKKRMKGKEEKFKKWATDKVMAIFGDPTIKIGRKSVPYTLDNIVEYMTRGGVQAKEKTMTFGGGKARAVASKRFDSLQWMRNEAEWNLKQKSELAKEREEADEKLSDFRSAVIDYYTIKDWRGEVDTWEGFDDSMKALAAIAKQGNITKSGLRAALNRVDFKGVSDEVLEKGIEATRAMLDAPVPYFESKPNTAGQLEEFKGAVIPKDASDETKAILDRHGVEYTVYGETFDEVARTKAVVKLRKKLSKQGEEVLFQAAPARITNIRQLAKSLGGIDYNKEHLKGELDKLKEDAPATRLVINRRGQGVTLDRLLEAAIEAEILSETATLDDVINALETNLQTAEAIQEDIAKDERISRRIEAREYESAKLKAEFIKVSQKARKAFREGKAAGVAKEAKKLKNILARTRKINMVKEYFNLTDADLKKISRKNPLLLSQYEFKLYLDNVRAKSVQLTHHNLQKAALINMIHVKDLGHVDNYRRVLGYPPIEKMTTEQLQDFASALEPFAEGDVFLSERQLETVESTDLAGIATWREAKERLLADINKRQKKQYDMVDLEAIKIKEWDDYKWDTSLAETNPWYNMLVTETTKKLLEAELRVHEVENEVFELAKKSQKSRGLTWVEKAIPQDQQVFDYIEAPPEEKNLIAADMTSEQLDLAHYIQSFFHEAREYLIKTKAMDKGRENYFVHMRKTFLENVKDEGIIKGIFGVFQQYQEDEAVFNILDDDTGNILPLEKFFQFALQRTGELAPSTNVVRTFLAYVSLIEKKKSLDALIPKMDIYAQSITPQKYTPRGLEADRSIKKFLNRWMNSKKGRKDSKFIAKQGGKIDLSLRGIKTVTTMIDLGGSLPVGAAAFVGETAANFTMLGTANHLKGVQRSHTKKGKAILEKYEGFVGRSAWEEFAAPGKDVADRLSDGLFALFHQATVTANKHFLLGSISKEEYDGGELSSERLAELKIEMGRFRVVPGTKSIAGATSVGSAMMQYKTWAAPVLRTNLKNLETIIANRKAKGVLSSKEAREIYRVVGQIGVALTIAAMVAADEDDNSLIGQTIKKMMRESTTLLQGMDPTLWLGTPRLYSFMADLAKNIKAIIFMEEYKQKEGLRGVEGLKKQFTPRAIKQFIPKPKKKERL